MQLVHILIGLVLLCLLFTNQTVTEGFGGCRPGACSRYEGHCGREYRGSFFYGLHPYLWYPHFYNYGPIQYGSGHYTPYAIDSLNDKQMRRNYVTLDYKKAKNLIEERRMRESGKKKVKKSPYFFY